LLYYVDPFTGREVSKSAKTADHRTAERLAAKWETEIEAGATTRNMSWDQFKLRANTDYLAAKIQTTRNGYLRAMEVFEEIVGRPKFIGMIGAEVLGRFVSGMAKAEIGNATAAKHVRYIRALLRWAWKMEFIDRQPAVTMPRVGEQAKGRPLTDDEFAAMLAALPSVVDPATVPQWERFIRGLWLSGFRLRELIALSWDSPPVRLRMSGRFPAVEWSAEGQKSRRVETMPLTPDFAELLTTVSADARSGPVFPLPVVSHFTVCDTISQIGEKAGIVVSDSGKFASAHDLRRTFASRWSLKVTPAVLKSLMRHASIATTMAYYVRHDSDDIAAILAGIS
jgi:integrase